MPPWLQVTLPIVAGILLAMIAVIWRLLNDRIDAIWNQLGRSSQEGMRKTLHDTANETQRIEALDIRIRRFEDRENGRR